MADLISDGKTRVTWLSTVANINAPTTAELNAGDGEPEGTGPRSRHPTCDGPATPPARRSISGRS